jgi:hypothetical protein
MTTPIQAPGEEPRTCPECGDPLAGKYCHQCGEKPLGPDDLKLGGFLHHGLHELTHLDAKIFSTLRALVFKPGLLTTEYLAGRKKRHVLPLRLFLVIFALNLFLYTRPGIALYDMRFVVKNDKQGVIEKKLEAKAKKLNQPTDALYDRINEHWQKYVSLLQFGDVFFFAIWLSLLFYTSHRYFVEHLIFSLHTLSFVFLLSTVLWLYYAFRGMHPDLVVALVSFAALLLYLCRAIPRAYGTAGWSVLLKSFLLLVGLEITRVFFICFTLVLALIQTLRTH